MVTCLGTFAYVLVMNFLQQVHMLIEELQETGDITPRPRLIEAASHADTEYKRELS